MQKLVVIGVVSLAMLPALAACGIDEPLLPVHAPPAAKRAPGAPAQPSATTSPPPPSSHQCGGVSITPWTPADAFGEFQAEPGTGAQGPIEVVPSCPARSITVTIYDPDFAGNQLVAYEGDAEIGHVDFDDGVPGVLTTDTKTVTAPSGESITRAELVAAPNDYVTWGDLVID
jgi:hypothetical protein